MANTNVSFNRISPIAANTRQIDVSLAGRTDVPVLITSDDRTQRGVCARLIHGSSLGRRTFVVYPLPIPGATAAARVERRGKAVLRRAFEQARGGTLFIDYIERLTAPEQSELLALLEERLQHAVSSRDEDERSTRIIAGASHPLVAERRTGAFSQLLFYRLNVIHVDLTIQRPRERR